MELIERLLEERQEARKTKDWARADELKALLVQEHGVYSLSDSVDSTTYVLKTDYDQQQQNAEQEVSNEKQKQDQSSSLA